jgi:hypothetical protein
MDDSLKVDGKMGIGTPSVPSAAALFVAAAQGNKALQEIYDFVSAVAVVHRPQSGRVDVVNASFMMPGNRK